MFVSTTLYTDDLGKLFMSSIPANMLKPNELHLLIVVLPPYRRGLTFDIYSYEKYTGNCLASTVRFGPILNDAVCGVRRIFRLNIK